VPNLSVLIGDAADQLSTLPEKSVQTCVTSPPYWNVRDYSVECQIGLEATFEEWLAKMLIVFRQVHRVLKLDGTLWVQMGDSYVKKNLVGQPWALAFALKDQGWILRSDIIYSKKDPMPEGVADRPTRSHEFIFLLTKSAKYYYDIDAIRERTGNEMSDQEYAAAIGKPWSAGGMTNYAGSNKHDGGRSHPLGRNKRTVWTLPTAKYSGAHFATFPPKLIEPCILAGSRPGDVVLDPFAGSGTTAMVALEHGRDALMIELNPAYEALIRERCGRSTELVEAG
jgi:DNA modification methylase